MSAYITHLDADKWLVEIDAPNSGKGFFCLTRSDANDAKEIIAFQSQRILELTAGLNAAGRDLAALANNVAIVYEHVTNGKASKPFTDPQTICDLNDDVCTEICTKETAALQRKLAEVEERIASLYRIMHEGTKQHLEAEQKLNALRQAVESGIKCINNLANQQAMQDDSYLQDLAILQAALAPDSAAVKGGE